MKLELVFRSLCVVASERATQLHYQTAFLFWASKNFAWQRALHKHLLCGKDVEGFALSVGTPWSFSWKTEANTAIPARVCDYWLQRAFQLKNTSFMVPFASLSCPEILDIAIILVPVQCNLPLLMVQGIFGLGGQKWGSSWHNPLHVLLLSSWKKLISMDFLGLWDKEVSPEKGMFWQCPFSWGKKWNITPLKKLLEN